jgi:hypothetical protein
VGLDRTQIEDFERAGTLILDDRRRRPLYFDGRFLAARDLTRDQNYFLSRQADLGRAGGVGVVSGLQVTRGTTASALEISAGHGVTASGELVVVPRPLTLSVLNIPEAQRLNATFGLSRIPSEPTRSRSGLFIVALRAVEFTATPTTAYPTQITGNRTTHDSEIIEAAAVTLIPYVDEGPTLDPSLRRARVARELFVMGTDRGLPVDALPLALIALDLGVVQWIDPCMVRRAVGSNRSDILGLGFAPRALREAHFLQYDRQLLDVLQQRDANNSGRRFPATMHFMALPPGGRLPTAAINPNDFTQTFFPAEIDVELSLMPEDEALGLIEESLLLPPIDLTLTGEELTSTAVLVLIPVPRPRLRTLVNSLTTLTRTLLPAAPGLIAKRTPLEALLSLGRLPRLPHPPLDPTTAVDAVWREALASVEFLWYVRRRNLQYRVDVVGVSQPVITNEAGDEDRLRDRISGAGMGEVLTNLRARATTLANAATTTLLLSPKFDLSPTLLRAALHALEQPLTQPPADPTAPPPVLDRATVLQVSERFADPQLGEGILRLEQANPELRQDAVVVNVLGNTGLVPELDRLARTLPQEALTTLSHELADAARANDMTRITTLVSTRLGGLRQ